MTRRDWCAALAKLVSPSFPLEAQRALTDMLPALQHLPDTLFTNATLLEVAGAKRRQAVPSWDEITAAVSAYRRTYLHVPRLQIAAPTEPERRAPTPEEAARVAETVRQCRAEMAAAEAAEQAERPLRDVTLKGEALVQSRLARGCNVRVPGYTPREVRS